MPVVATPVGGLVEQVVPGQTGVLARDVTPRAIADAIHQLVALPGLYDRISSHLARTYDDRSMDRFLSELLTACQ
jgi:glycosyltransferase involved in cell wall biosynthesis